MSHGDEVADLAITDVLNVIGDLAAPLERSAVLERVGRAAAKAIGAEMGFVGTLDGPDRMKLTGIHGANTNALERIRVSRGLGLGGKVLATQEPSSVDDYTTADSITHEYDAEIAEEGLQGLLCLPLVVGAEIAGVAYVADRVPKVYSDVMIERVLNAVESAKLALSLADRSRALTQAAVEAERERTAEALDASVGEHLNDILATAQTLAKDPNSSPEIVEQALSLVANVGLATTALEGTVSGLILPEAPRPTVPTVLSRRELEVVRFAAQGMSNPEIAEELFLARGTVKAYMESVLRKLNARNRVEAVMVAARSGLLDDI